MEKRVLGVLGGRDVSGALFKLWAQSAHILVAADSGADFAIEQECRPDAIVGDMDSISEAALDSGIDLYRIDDQNHTDCDKLLELVHGWGLGSITLIGVEGDRLDHLLATLHSCAKSPIDVRIAIRDGLGHMLHPGMHNLAAIPGRRISVIPLNAVDGVEMVGVRWPLDDASLELGSSISVSNIAEAETIGIQFRAGKLLVLQEFPIHDLPIWPD